MFSFIIRTNVLLGERNVSATILSAEIHPEALYCCSAKTFQRQVSAICYRSDPSLLGLQHNKSVSPVFELCSENIFALGRQVTSSRHRNVLCSNLVH